jgi:hypothetical protein
MLHGCRQMCVAPVLSTKNTFEKEKRSKKHKKDRPKPELKKT